MPMSEDCVHVRCFTGVCLLNISMGFSLWFSTTVSLYYWAWQANMNRRIRYLSVRGHRRQVCFVFRTDGRRQHGIANYYFFLRNTTFCSFRCRYAVCLFLYSVIDGDFRSGTHNLFCFITNYRFRYIVDYAFSCIVSGAHGYNALVVFYN